MTTSGEAIGTDNVPESEEVMGLFVGYAERICAALGTSGYEGAVEKIDSLKEVKASWDAAQMTLEKHKSYPENLQMANNKAKEAVDEVKDSVKEEMELLKAERNQLAEDLRNLKLEKEKMVEKDIHQELLDKYNRLQEDRMEVDSGNMDVDSGNADMDMNLGNVDDDVDMDASPTRPSSSQQIVPVQLAPQNPPVQHAFAQNAPPVNSQLGLHMGLPGFGFPHNAPMIPVHQPGFAQNVPPYSGFAPPNMGQPGFPGFAHPFGPGQFPGPGLPGPASPGFAHHVHCDPRQVPGFSSPGLPRSGSAPSILPGGRLLPAPNPAHGSTLGPAFRPDIRVGPGPPGRRLPPAPRPYKFLIGGLIANGDLETVVAAVLDGMMDSQIATWNAQTDKGPWDASSKSLRCVDTRRTHVSLNRNLIPHTSTENVACRRCIGARKLCVLVGNRGPIVVPLPVGQREPGATPASVGYYVIT
ncbi:hypothetical protein EG329_000315 [Mollisiaceae sp. DMI_Dod_QoI]|nr:hypothetical protein EG329_000315 [Helotiales sp. DMI_Dod_QoI]